MEDGIQVPVNLISAVLLLMNSQNFSVMLRVLWYGREVRRPERYQPRDVWGVLCQQKERDG